MISNNFSDNLYNILELNSDASSDEIKQAYRSLSLKHHPDKSGNCNIKKKIYQDILNAYEVLSDPNKKKIYDFKSSSNKNNIERLDEKEENKRKNNNKNLNDLENNFVPETIEKIINISLEQAFIGGLVPLEVEKYLNYTNNRENKKEIELIYVAIKEGIDNNEIIIIKNKGNCINDIIYGDIKVKIKINEDSNFKRRGLDLIKVYKITLKEALCGFEFKLKHLNKEEYTIKNDGINIIKEGEEKRITKLGMKRDDFKGDLVIQFQYKYPEYLTEKQRLEISKVL